MRDIGNGQIFHNTSPDVDVNGLNDKFVNINVLKSQKLIQHLKTDFKISKFNYVLNLKKAKQNKKLF